MPFIRDTPSPPANDNPNVRRPDISERQSVYHSADVVIVGAGIAGTAAAVAFGKQGRSVILLEKSLKEPDRIVGELLQPGGVRALEQLGLRDCLEGIDAVVVDGYDVIYYGEEVHIPYTPQLVEDTGHDQSDESSDSDAKPFSKRRKVEGRSFHHGRFVQKLREAAMKAPNVYVVETTVTGLIKSDLYAQILGVECLTHGEKDYYFGDLTIAADGYASKLRSTSITRSPVARSRFWGLELQDAVLPMPKHGHVVLGDSAPVLLYQIGQHETRILVDIPEGTPTAAPAAGGTKGHLKNVVLPALPKCVQPSFAEALAAGKLRSMPNSWLPPTRNRTPGLMILGDAANMRHPLTGGGMTVALNDVVLLSELLHPDNIPDLNDTTLVLKALRQYHWRRKHLSSTINILAQALYALFAANDRQLRALQRGCFEYFKLGGSCVEGPVGLLAGILRQPLTLVYHFFAVALYAMYLYMVSWSVLLWPIGGLASIAVFAKACVVILPYIFLELQR